MSVLAEPSTTATAADPRPPLRKFRLRNKATDTAVISLCTLIALVLAWVVATNYHLASALFLPSPNDVLIQFLAIASDGYANGTLAEHVAASLGRISVALAFGVGVGVPIGLIMGLNRWAKGGSQRSY